MLDPNPRCSAASVADELLIGGYDRLHDLRILAARSDVVTFEIELVDADALRRLQSLGHLVAPAAEVLETVQDKLLQKHFLRAHGIPTGAFSAHLPTAADAHPLPFMWKARRGGYDGRAVVRVDTEEVRASLPAVPALVEDVIDIERELAIMVARDASGAIECHPLVELLMDPDAHVLDLVRAPATVGREVRERCVTIATEIVSVLEHVGVLAVEFFLTPGGQVLVNEISPRPHNSGHYSIEACETSQFEQHLRAVAGLGLRKARLHSSAVCFNVRGTEGASGTPRYLGFEAAARIPGVYVHRYDKAQVRPGRKMAHVTVIGTEPGQLLAQALQLKAELSVVACDG